MSHLQFRRDVTRTLLSRQIDRARMGGPSCAPGSLVRYDGINIFWKAAHKENVLGVKIKQDSAV